MITEVKFTPTEARLLKLLSTGDRVHKSEMFEALGMEGDGCDHRTIHNHIKNMRPKLLDSGLKIIVEFWQRRTFYVMVRNIHSANE